MSALKVFQQILKYDILLAIRQKSEWINPILFYVIVVSLFPLAITPQVEILRSIGPGVIWIGALLATLLSLERLFRDDYIDGSLEQYIISPYPFPLILFAKVTAHWLVIGVPFLIVSPVLALLLYLPLNSIGVLMLSLALGTPILILIGALVVALTLGSRNHGILLSLLVIPLFIPVLIFGTGAVINAVSGLSSQGALLMLLAMLIMALSLTPIAISSALKA